MRRIIYYLIPVVTLVFFSLIMLSGAYLKNSKGLDDFPIQLESVKIDISSGQWANEESDTLSSSQVLHRLPVGMTGLDKVLRVQQTAYERYSKIK